MEFVFDLSSPLDCFSPELVGNKAYSLAFARNNRFPVPRSFALSVHALEESLKSDRNDISFLLSQCTRNPDKAEEILSGIQNRIRTSALPLPMVEEIYTAFSSLDSEYAAVRSSAVGEDGDARSMAGQYDSYLGVREDKLLEAIKACWASLFGARAYHYKGCSTAGGNMAVLIQEMIDADISGVCFSVHPVTKRNDDIIIEAVRGLGELLVQGTVVPDHYYVSRDSLQVVAENSHIGFQEEKISLDTCGGGCVRTPVGCDQNCTGRKVPDDKIREIASSALEAERIYQKPVDMEWALKNDRLFILQIRPVTGI